MAEEFLSPIDMLLDENNKDNIKLYNEDNNRQYPRIESADINLG